MFRPATIEEVECLLPRTALPPKEEGPQADKLYKKAIGDLVRQSMLAQASKFILVEMRTASQRKLLEEGTEMKFEDCCNYDIGSSCSKCQEICTDFAERVLTVLEHDFVQFTHGVGATLLQNRNGVQFLLTGISLGLLYESASESQGLKELITQVMIQMLDLEAWNAALQMQRPPGQPVLVNPQKCVQCGASFITNESIQECDCNTVTIRYREQLCPSVEQVLMVRPRANSI
eukprot:m.73725 g.73725  ORF g.73725 m.73725 type:complete len:232 (-) comp24589_c0_seq1:112-807(-)